MKSKSNNPKDTASQTPVNVEPQSWLATEKIVVRAEGEESKPVWQQFPGPRNAEVALRVAMERRANADLIAHAKESLEVEVCGVLVGTTCEDEEGVFVHVAAVIRGEAASEASTHVTFTQNTWNTIHQTLERDYSKLRIVGWYHTHPGFGVEFSEMDLFIQKNFFPGAAQIALVTDPLSGAVAICVNTPEGIRYLPKFWVDGREQTSRVPVRNQATRAAGAANNAALSSPNDDIARLETRVSQLIQTVDQQRAWQHNFMLFCGTVFCCAVLIGIAYFLFKTYTSRLEPPQMRQMVPVAIQVGDKRVMIGVAIAEWEVPEELNAILLQEHLLQKEAEAKAAKEAELQRQKAMGNSTNAASPGTNSNSPAAKEAPTTGVK